MKTVSKHETLSLDLKIVQLGRILDGKTRGKLINSRVLLIRTRGTHCFTPS